MGFKFGEQPHDKCNRNNKVYYPKDQASPVKHLAEYDKHHITTYTTIISIKQMIIVNASFGENIITPTIIDIRNEYTMDTTAVRTNRSNVTALNVYARKLCINIDITNKKIKIVASIIATPYRCVC